MDDLTKISADNWDNLNELYNDIYSKNTGIKKVTDPVFSIYSSKYEWPNFSLFETPGHDIQNYMHVLNENIESFQISPFILLHPSLHGNMDISCQLEKYNIRQIGYWPLIYYNLTNSLPIYEEPLGFRIDVVDDENRIKEWHTIVKNVLFKGRAIPVRGFDSSTYLLLIGYDDNVPVATIMMYYGSKTSSAHIGAVLPEYRGRGYGKLIYREALKMAASRGYSISFGQSSMMGLSSWLKLGFTISGHIDIFWKIGYQI